MKLKVIALLVCLTLATALLTGCSGLFGSNNDSDQSEEEQKPTASITVYVDDAQQQFSVPIGEVAKVKTFTKNGYYLKGYYSEKEGGNKYFDASGTSVGLWQEINPTTLYAQWEKLDALEPHKFDTKMVNQPEGDSSWWLQETLPAEYYNAVQGNLDAAFIIKLEYQVKCSAEEVAFIVYDRTDDAKEKFGEDTVQTGGSEYHPYTREIKVNAKAFVNGKVYIYAYWIGLGWTNTIYFKNLTISIALADDSAENGGLEGTEVKNV